MKRLLGPLVIVVTALAAAKLGSDAYQARTLELDRQRDLARIRQSYFERVGWIRSNPDEKGYREELPTFMRQYFKEVDEHVSRFSLDPSFDAFLDDLAKREKEGKEPKAAERKARFEAVKKHLELLRSGRYAPRWTGTDKGMRLDILSATRGLKGARPVIEMPFVLWGAQRELRDDGRGQKRMSTSANFHFTLKLVDSKGKMLGELNGDGAEGLVDWPEFYVELFPPQVIFGTFLLEPIPAEVATVEMTFTVDSHAPSGGNVVSTYAWKMDTPEDWKLKPGEAWEGAQESVRPAEEIDPSKKKR
jgi:hypothetical protein